MKNGFEFWKPKIQHVIQNSFIFCYKMLKLWSSEVTEAILEQVTVAK